jgi:hypothetical protein
MRKKIWIFVSQLNVNAASMLTFSDVCGVVVVVGCEH